MAAPIRFLSGRQQQQKIGIEGSTEDKKVLEVVGRAGIGTTSFEPSKVLDVRGDAIVEGTATLGNLEITGTGGVPASLNVASTLSVTGLSTFSSAVDVNAGLDVDGQADLDEVVVAGVATFSNAVDINSTLDVDGDTQLDDLNVAGVATFSSNVNATGISSAKAFANFDYLQAPFGSTVSFTVTVASKSNHRYQGQGSGQAYYINGVESPFLTLTPGRTYRFVHDNTGSHPLKFYLEADKTTLYETNVDFQNTYTEITVTDETPIVLHYQCTNHGFMGNAVQTNANVVNTNYPATIRSTLNVTGVSTFPQLDVSTGGLDVDGLTNLDEVVVAGVSTFTGNIVAVSAEFSGNVTIAGTLTAEDKTNIDSLGIVTARTGVRVDAGGLIVTSGVSTFTDSVDIDNGVGVVGGLTADSLTISGVTTGINAAGISSFVRIDVDGQADLDEVVIAGVATFQGAVNFDVNSEINIGTGVTILGNNLHVTGIVSAAQFIGDGSGITNLPGISTLGSSNLTDVNVSGTTTTAQLRVSGIGTAEKFFVSTGGFEVDGQSDLDELVVAGVSTFNANTNVVGDLSVTGDIGASGIITATGINLVAGSGLDVGAIGVLTALSVDVSTGGIDVDGQATLDEVVVAGVATFSALADVNNRLDVAGGANIDQLNVAGIASFTQLDVSTGGIDVDGQATLDEVVVSGASTFTGTVKIDGALDIGVAGVDVEGLTNLDELIVAGVSTFSSTINGNVTGNLTGTASNASGATGDFSIADKIVHTGDTNTALRFPAADTFTIETAGSERVRVTSAGNVNFLGSLVNVNATGVSSFVQLDVSTGGLDVDGQTDLDEVVVAGASTFTGAVKIDGALDIGTAGVDIDGQTDLDELQVAGVSTFSAKAVFNTAYPSIDADNEIQVGTAIQLGKAGVVTATTFVGNLTGDVTGTASNASGATGDFSIADKIVHTGDTDTAIRFPAANTFSVETAGSERLRVGALGVVAIGTHEGTTINFAAAQTQIFGTVGDRILSLMYTQANASGPQLNFAKGRDLDNSASTAVNSGDLLGSLHFAGADGSDFNSVGAEIVVKVDGSPGSDDMPGRIEFKTTANGESTTTERLRISADGTCLFSGAVDINAGLDVDGQTDLDELQVAGVSTFSAKAVFNTAYPSIDADNEIQVGTAIQLGKAGVITATSFSGDGSALTGIAATDHVSTFDLVVAGISTFNDDVRILAGGLDVTGVVTATQLDVSTGGLDVDGETQLDELVVAGIATFQTHVELGDDDELRLGNSDDLKIYHDASHSYIEESGTGALKLKGDDIRIENTSSRNVFKAVGTACELYFDNGSSSSKRFETTTDGADFSGTGGVKLPVGSTAQRPGSPTAGDLRYNSDDGAFEGYTDSWGSIGGGTPEVDTNVSSTSAVGVGSFATASFRSAEVVAQIVQIDEYQVGKYLMIHDGTTVTVIEQTAVATGDAMLGSFDGAINGSNVELRVNMVSSGIATVTTKISTVTV